MYYIIYKITNKIDGKFYIGSHKTKNLDDNYMGSGKYLKRAQEKYGIENFEKEILFVFDNSGDMYNKEAEIVNEDFLATENTYNLKLGGFGGWDHENQNSDKQRRKCIAGNLKQKWLLENDPNWKGRENQKRAASETFKRLHKEGKFKYDGFKGKTHSFEFKEKISEIMKLKQKGSRNSQFGTCWISFPSLMLYKKCRKELLPLYLDQGWYKGKKFNAPLAQ